MHIGEEDILLGFFLGAGKKEKVELTFTQSRTSRSVEPWAASAFPVAVRIIYVARSAILAVACTSKEN